MDGRAEGIADHYWPWAVFFKSHGSNYAENCKKWIFHFSGGGSANLAKTLSNIALAVSLITGAILLVVFVAGQYVLPKVFTDLEDVLDIIHKGMNNS